jgi:lipopolysaccharide transport system ATP-binding protein
MNDEPPCPVEHHQPPAIRVHRVSKLYRMWATPASRLWVPMLLRAAGTLESVRPAWSRALRAAAARRMHVHQALEDVSLELEPGDSLGIIGLNGSGKSTLLQIIAGVLPATSGTVEVHGRVAALLELGSGFNPELTGRENIFINGAILGMERAAMERVLDQIIAFADIGRYIDEPVKTYSSGMVVRLAFAVQVHTSPDVLIVDEALAVGDAAFQAKAMARIDRILEDGTTLLFVGHDLNAVKAFCQRAALLEQGRIVMQGLPDEVVTEYLHRTHRRALEERRREAADRMIALEDGYGAHDTRVLQGAINDVSHATLHFNQEVSVALLVRLGPGVRDPQIIVDVMDGRGLQLTGRRISLPPGEGVRDFAVTLGFRACLQQGVYRIRTRIVDAPSLDDTTVLARQEGRLSFEIVDDSREAFTGLFPMPMEIRVRPS